MVSMITEGTATDEKGRRFLRRRPTPWLVMIGVLTVLCGFVWIGVFAGSEQSTTAMSCNSPAVPASTDPSAPVPATLGARVGSSRLTDVDPAALSATRVRVYNANGQRGQAAHIAAQLSDYGFASAPDVQVGNDPIYLDQNMECSAQIRFGPNGAAAAATVQLVAPCSELIEDSRPDDTVDLALGNYFSDISPNNDAEEVLRTLRAAPAGQAAPADMDLLEAARTARC
ncbi:envelope integrity protein Cei [Aldersonia kunmingensis]|uniref:envelope integrity protein Cei n=1 Tax=Aldersonia kunmingensis TaxID=408066 RepID=UPI00082EA41D|nr:envelope integrity protein Cei [Aldersonia kunmingensis]